MSYPGPGYIREEKDVMYLILFALNHFPMAISESDLMDVVMIDDGFSYFEFRSALLRLQSGRQVACTEESGEPRYFITPEGGKIIDILARELPRSIRDRAEAAALRVIAKVRRDSSIQTSHTQNPDGTYTVRLCIRDDSSEQMAIQLLVMTLRQCRVLEDQFRRRAEPIYQDLLLLLSGAAPQVE